MAYCTIIELPRAAAGPGRNILSEHDLIGHIYRPRFIGQLQAQAARGLPSGIEHWQYLRLL